MFQVSRENSQFISLYQFNVDIEFSAAVMRNIFDIREKSLSTS